MTKVEMPPDPNWTPLCFGKDCDPYTILCGGCKFYSYCSEIVFNDTIIKYKERYRDLKIKSDETIRKARKDMEDAINKAIDEMHKIMREI